MPILDLPGLLWFWAPTPILLIDWERERERKRETSICSIYLCIYWLVHDLLVCVLIWDRTHNLWAISCSLFPKSLLKALENQRESKDPGEFVPRKWHWIGKEMWFVMERRGQNEQWGSVRRHGNRTNPMPGWIYGDSSKHHVQPAWHMIFLLWWPWVEVYNDGNSNS